MENNTKKRGFTLVELMAIIGILAVILVITVPQINNYILLNKKQTFITNALNILRQLEYDNMDFMSFDKAYIKDFDLKEINKKDIDVENSLVYVQDREIYIDLVGKGAYEGFYVCNVGSSSKNVVVQEHACGTTTEGLTYVDFDVDLDGGKTSQEFADKYGVGNYLVLQIPKKEGQTFNGWEIVTGNSIISENRIKFGTEATRIKAKWKGSSILTIDLNGGDSSQPLVGEYVGGTIIRLAVPTRTDYKFTGWEVVEGNSIISGNMLTMGSENTKIKAKWKINIYTINYNLNGGTEGSSMPTSGLGESTVTVSNPTRTGYTFNGWTVTGDDASMNGTNLIIGTGDITLTANWTINTYTISYDLDGGTAGLSAPTSGTYGSTVTVSNPTKEEYTFIGWTVTGTGAILSGTNLTIGTGNISLTANFIKTIVEYAYTGGEQTYTVPVTGYYKIEVWGGQGNSYNTTYIGGKGAYAGGNIYLDKNTILYIYVGGKGIDKGVNAPYGSYLFNGASGGNYACYSYFNGTSTYNHYGGSATDIRLVNGSWDDSESLNSRIMVAAGGAAANQKESGSAGGDINGKVGATGTRATQTSGGGPVSGGFGYGATPPYNGSVCNSSQLLGAGSGYYGGGSSNKTGENTGQNSAGGGSSFISGYAGVNAITSSSDRTHTGNTLHYSNKYFINGKMESGVNESDGKAIITYIGSNYSKVNTKLNNTRYIKDCVNGSTSSTNNHWTELQAIYNGLNVAKGKSITGTSSQNSTYPYSRITDGDVTYSNYAQAGTSGSLQCVTVDLTKNYDLDEIAVWHYYGDARSYKNHSLYVSSDNETWTTLIDNVSGVTETSNGIRISAYEQ